MAQLVRDASEGKVPFERETLAGLLKKWLEHIEARGRAAKTLLEIRSVAAVIAEELGEKDFRNLNGRSLDGFYYRSRIEACRQPGISMWKLDQKWAERNPYNWTDGDYDSKVTPETQ